MITNTDPKIISAIIALITSILTLFLTWLVKIIYERNFHIFKLENEYKYEQRKQIKIVLSKFKTGLLTISEELNYRLWNFSKNINKNWHKIEKKDWTKNSKYYIQSFIYRFLIFFYHIQKIEKEVICLDTTVSTKEDFIFIKYLKTLQNIFCDAMLFESFDYDSQHPTNHFFKNEFECFTKYIIENKQIIDFETFKSKIKKDNKKIFKLYQYIYNIENNDKNLNWNVIKLFHFLLMIFLNKFGYDFQYTSKDKLQQLAIKYNGFILYENFIEYLNRNKMSKDNEIKLLIKIIEKYRAPSGT